jgi:hypothetical protein
MSRGLVGVIMLVLGGLFTGVLWTLAIERVWIWRALDARAFAADFRSSVQRIDVVQPVTGALATAAAIGYATTVPSRGQTLSIAAAALLLVVIVASAGIGVPIQKRFRRADADELSEGRIVELRGRWVALHLARTVAGVAAFVLLAVAALYP